MDSAEPGPKKGVVSSKVEAFFSDKEEDVYRKNEILTFAHQDPQGVAYVTEGLIEQYDVTSEGNKVTVNMFKPGSFFPMSWAIHKNPNEYFFAAFTEVRVKWAQPEAVIKFLGDNPDVMLDLLSRVYVGTDALLKRLVLAASGIASNRLIFELLIEAYRFNSAVGDEKVTIKVRQNSLASRSGLARETVSRELHKLEGEGLLVLNRGGMMLDVAALERKLDMTV